MYSEYALEVWFPGKKVEIIETHDRSEALKMDAGHVVAIEGGEFAFVRESGCSCYSYDDAEIKMFRNKDEALGAFLTWRGAR